MALVADRADHHAAELAPADAADVVFDALPDGLIDLPSASKKYGIKSETIRRWVGRGRIAQQGWLLAPRQNRLVIHEQELVAYMQSEKSKGGRPRKSR